MVHVSSTAVAQLVQFVDIVTMRSLIGAAGPEHPEQSA